MLKIFINEECSISEIGKRGNNEVLNTSRPEVFSLVEKNSLVYQGNNIYEFNITDNNNNLSIIYEGILPDLFREQQGAVVEGKVIKNNVLEASTVFAKHDENYMPETIKKQLIDNQYWKQEYK